MKSRNRMTALFLAVLMAMTLMVTALPVAAQETKPDLPLGGLWQGDELEIVTEEERATAETAETAEEDGVSAQAETYNAVTGTGTYYTYLTAGQKAAYDALLIAVSDVENCEIIEFASGISMPLTDIREALNAFQYDHPEVFWTGGSISIRSAGTSGYYKGVGLNAAKILTNSADTLAALCDKYKAGAQKILKAANLNGNDAQIALSLHDALAAAVTYDYASLNTSDYLPHTAYNAFVERTCVCDGYAKAYAYLLKQCGITATILTSSTLAHAWSMVRLGDDWYETDVTWDDSSDAGNHDFYDLTTAAMTAAHRNTGRDSTGTGAKLPTATGTKYTYAYLKVQPTATPTPTPSYGTGVAGFVTRLYGVCMNRTPDANGKAYWVNKLTSKQSSGTEVAYGFVFSDEFKKKNYCNTDYVKQLYRAFMGREYDDSGLQYWLAKLEGGAMREEVLNGFAQSTEFGKICANYAIDRGDPVALPDYGTVPTGACTTCGEEDGVTAFVTRLYAVCLGRAPETNGLAYWTGRLWSHTESGKTAAHGFVFSDEFVAKRYSNSAYLDHLYRAFMGRSADANGKAYWLNKMAAGATREDVFAGFVGSDEFSGICASYGIVRG